MAAASGRALLCVCSVIAMFLLLHVDGTTAAQGTRDSIGLVGEAAKAFYLRGNPQVVPSTEVDSTEERAERSFESFARRELESDYGEDPADANCDTNRTNCP